MSKEPNDRAGTGVTTTAVPIADLLKEGGPGIELVALALSSRSIRVSIAAEDQMDKVVVQTTGSKQSGRIVTVMASDGVRTQDGGG